MSESDGMEETFEGQLRLGLLIAGRVAEEVARLREQSALEAEARSLQHAREQQGRVAAERDMARAALAPVERDGWWERARPDDVAAAWQTARTWEAVEPDARRAADTIRTQVRDRYGIDIDDLLNRDQGGRAPASVEEALQRVLEERRGPLEVSREERARAAQDVAVATLLASESAQERDAVDRSRDTGPDTEAEVEGAGYDTPERRRELAEHLGRTVDPQHTEAIEARVVADTANASPITDVTGLQRAAHAGRPRRRMTLARGQQRSAER